MRLSLRTKQVLGVTALVGAVVAGMSVVDLAQQAHVRLEEGEARGRLLAQSICEMGPAESRRVYLVRVVVDVVDDAIDVVTAYRTSEISRYWRGVQ